MAIEFEVTVSGPVFDGRAEAAASDYSIHVQQEFADELQEMVIQNLMGVLRRNRGIYISYIHQVKEDSDIVITDRWIIYGPWLEGVGSRVGPVGTGKWPYTRFPGYHTFRRTTQEFELTATDRAEAELTPYLAEMND